MSRAMLVVAPTALMVGICVGTVLERTWGR